MNDDVAKAYAEVDEILNVIDKEYLDKVPVNIRTFFENARLKDYKPNINIQLPLNEQKLQRKTLVFLAILYLNYWCNSEEEKQELLHEFSNNEKIQQQELRKKYDPNKIFNNNHDIKKSESLEIIEYKKDNIFKKIINKIISIFKK